MNSLFQINRWETRKFLWLVFTIQLAMLGLAGLAALGFDIPILRQIVGFIYLTFVPGLLILRVLRLNRLGTIETLLYSVGLSIALVMFTGFLMNMLYPLIGISRPISILPVLVTITFIVLVLCAIVYKRELPEEESLSQSSSIGWSELFSPPVLFLFLLPILAALGTLLVNRHQSNILSLIFLSLIVLVVILVVFNKFIPARLYPLVIVAIGLGLLWQWSLVSPGLTGFDIGYEYYWQNLVVSNSNWDYTISSNVNAMLSVVMLAPVYSLLLNLDAIWVFKIIYPVVYSLVPLALFQAYRKQTGDKVAFFGVFFFVSFHMFFAVMIDVPRQQIAELFLALSLLLFLSKEIIATKRAALIVIFGLSIIVSHYGLSYLYVIYLLAALPLLLLLRSRVVTEWWGNKVARFSKGGQGENIAYQSEESASGSARRSPLSATYVMIFIVFCLAWYMYICAGLAFASIVRIGEHLYSILGTELFSLGAREQVVAQAIGLGPWPVGIENMISRAIFYATMFFIVVGIIELVVNLRKTRFHREYVAMSLTSMLIIALYIVLPYISATLGSGRTYHITLFFLAPFCVLGGMAVFRWLFKAFSLLSLPRLATSVQLSLVVILVLVPYFLFNNGFTRELTGNYPRMMPLALYEQDNNFFNEPEICAREWLGNVAESEFTIYSDGYGRPLLSQKFHRQSRYFPSDVEPVSQDSYIFLRRWNIIHGEVLMFRKVGVTSTPEYLDLEDETAFSNELQHRSKIYDSGEAQIYR